MLSSSGLFTDFLSNSVEITNFNIQLSLIPTNVTGEKTDEKVQIGKDQEKAQSEKDCHSKNRGGKNQTNNQGPELQCSLNVKGDLVKVANFSIQKDAF